MCDCFWEAMIAMYTRLHTLPFERHGVDPACLCGYVALRMFHAEHCLLEQLRKSPQCDNWLPGVLLFFSAHHHYPLKRKKLELCVSWDTVFSFTGEIDPKFTSTLKQENPKSSKVMRWWVQVWCRLVQNAITGASAACIQMQCLGLNWLF